MSPTLYSYPNVTGPNRILNSTEQNKDADGEKAGAKPKGEEGAGAAVAIENPGLAVVHPHSAGIDVGNSAHYVAVRPDRDREPVRRFECFTADIHRPTVDHHLFTAHPRIPAYRTGPDEYPNARLS